MIRKFIYLTLLLMVVNQVPARAGIFGDNKADDSFSIKSMDGKEATLEGTVKDLKAGDVLYSVKSPFKFKVTAVKGNQVTIALPDRHQLKDGMSLLRFITPSIKKSIETEARLKSALEE